MKKKAVLKNTYFVISLVLLISLMCIIFYLSSQTADESSKTSGSFISIIYDYLGVFLSQDQIRTLAHFSEFALLGFLTNNVFFSKTNKTKTFISIISAWCYAWTDEIHQIFVDGRTFQLIDLAVDLIGITLGVLLFCLTVKIIKSIILIISKCKKGGNRNEHQFK